MSEPFSRRGDEVRVRLDGDVRRMLASLPELLAEPGDASGRLSYRAHADDPAAEERYRDLIGESLEELRREDREALATGSDRQVISVAEAEAWMRVIGEARLVLAGRLGIAEDGWEQDADRGDPEFALLGYLGYLQDRLVATLG